ncbi:MAG: alpha-2-macroglobulin family protein [Alphaproteobacteria bacterium]|nr:alpha-2-macroglobulin family protein [Alphaproteobacteria bacterium]
MDDRKKRLLLVIGGALAFLAAAALAAVFVIGIPQEGGMLARLQDGLSAVTGGTAQSGGAATPREFAFRRLEVDVSKPEPEACLVFTRALDASGKTHYQDYLTIDPDTKVAVHVVDTRLCVAGLSFDKTYNVSLKDGLPAADGSTLTAETVPVELRDKPALVRFAGGIILPRENAAGVPVTTVNVEKLDLKIIRVGDRLLSQIETGAVDQTQLYGWDEKQLENSQGAVVWSGTMAVDNVKNGSVVTQIPIHDVLKGKKPGAYVLVASDAAKKVDDDDYGAQMATQWVVDSDISLTSFTADRAASGVGLTVFARSYSRATPLDGVRMTLIARNNNQLASVVTDSNGRADFDAGLLRATGGDQPVMVMAYGRGGDFSFLDLRRSAFDLTDRGVGGRASPGPVDAWLYTERGVYRPGETVQAVAMLRDRVGAALNAPLTLVAQRPDGIEVGRITVSGDKLLAGSAAWSLPLSASAPHGRWQISAYIDPKADAVGRVQFDVADFVPQRLKVTLAAEEKQIAPGDDFHVRAEARFLYGAPGSNLTGDAEATIAADPDPWPQYKGYRFGRMDDSFSETRVDMTVPRTNAAGVTTITGNTGALADTTLPLKATVRVSIHEPGGRTTDRSTDIPIRTHDVSIGIRPDFDGGSVPENARAGFEAIAIDKSGKRVALSGLTVSWVREDTTYQWFQSNGEWRYESVTRDRLITSTTMNIAAGAPLKLAQSMGWGTYRLTITDPRSGAASSYRFYSGWAASSAGDRPDRIPVAADKPSYAPGSVAHVRIKPNANGKALVVIASDKVFSSRLIDAPAGGATVDIPVSADWGAGAYVLVTDYRPLSQVTGREPVRSIGVAWIAVDNGPRTLGIALGVPDKVRPRQTVNVPVKLTGLASEAAYVTVAAVDEGILQLTDFKSPDPADHYFGKRRLGVMMRDDYGRLIRAEKGAVGSLREGGDSFGGRSLAVVPQKTVALFSGIVKVKPDGTAVIPLAIPDFNGSLRLMAVAWSADKLGHADKMLVVRDPVVADLVLPRFLAPGDRIEAALNLDNVEGAPGAYAAIITTHGPVSLPGGARTVVKQTLSRQQRALVPVTLTGAGIGIANITLDVTGPNGFHVSHGWPIQVRPSQLDQTREEEVPLAAGTDYVANRTLIAGLVPSTASVSLSVSAAHGWSNVAGLLKWLDKYPFGCLEQTVSRAQPLLLFNDVADLAGLPRDAALKDRIQASIDKVLDMQTVRGDFGMWGPGGDSEPFLGVYAMDFLVQAKARGFVVANDALARGTNWMRQVASGGGDDLARAYAFYVLASNGQANVSDLRYFSDTRVSKMSSALAAALTGAAAAAVGDRSRTEYGFARARTLLVNANPASYPHDVYGSLLRDLSGTLALAAESGKADLVPVLMDKARGMDMRAQNTTTQEKGWMLRAAYALTRQKTPLNVTVNGKPAQERAGAVRLSPTLTQLDAGVTVANKGDAQVWRTTAVSGTPDAALPPTADGLSLNKSIWTMSGSPADVSSLHQNDRVIVEISGQMPNNVYHQMGIVDLLPAGLEIEQPLKGDDAKAYPFVGDLTYASSQDARDDRFVATFDIGQRYRPPNRKGPEPTPSFHIAYIARAVSVGRFTLPAADAVDMYAPAVHARTSVGQMTIGKE